MRKLPAHLKKILWVNEYNECGNISGKIICECGCESFGLRYFGENYLPYCAGIKEVENRYALIIKVICRKCGKEWLLFDFSKHSYDGFICEDGVSVPDEKLVLASADGECDFKIKISMEFDNEEQFIEEVVNNPYENRNFVPDDRVNIWNWLVIDLKCCKSGKELNGFVNIELA